MVTAKRIITVLAAVLFIVPVAASATAEEISIQDSVKGDIYPSSQAGGLGFSSALADLNGDGDLDYLISRTDSQGVFRSSNNNQVFIKYGDGTLLGEVSLTSSTATITDSQQASAFGNIMATGDLNNDGYDDVVIGASSDDEIANDAGAVYILYGQAEELESMAATSLAKIAGEADGDKAGLDVAVGDLNNDGYDDIAVGAEFNDDAGSNYGSVYVIYGSSTYIESGGLDDHIQLSGTSAGRFGSGLAIGDVNDDVYNDLIIGQDGYSSSSGAVYLVPGGASQLTDNTSVDGNSHVRFQGEASNNFAGETIAVADVDNDSIGDIIVGAYGENTFAGAVYVVSGSNSLANASLSTAEKFSGVSGSLGYTLNVGDVNGDGIDDIIAGAESDGVGGKVYIIEGSASLSGASVSGSTAISASDTGVAIGFYNFSSGDVNNDGYADIFIGSPDISTDEYYGGEYYLYAGSSSPSSTATGSISNTFALDDVYEYLFNEDVSVGDLNGDGYDDFVLSSSQVYESRNNDGALFILYGSEDGFTEVSVEDVPMIYGDTAVGSETVIADLDLDGYDDLLFNEDDTNILHILYGGSSQLSGKNILSSLSTVTISGTLENISEIEVSDLDGNTYPEIIIGDSQDNTAASNAGAIHVFYDQGSRASSFTFGDGVKLLGDANASDLVGLTLSAGDMNGDGYGDLVVGGPGNDDGGSGAGAIYVLYGSATQYTDGNLSDNATTITGKAGDFMANTSIQHGDFNGDGYADAVVGASLSDEVATDSGVVYIVYGQQSELTDSSITGHVQIQGTDTQGNFGASNSVAVLDIQDDGYDDLVIGYEEYNSSNGALIFFNGSSTDLTSGTWEDLADYYEEGTGQYGALVFSGDYNADGYPDIYVQSSNAEFNYDTSLGTGNVIFGGSVDFTLLGSTQNVECGASYSDPGATAADYYTGQSLTVATSGTVDADTTGSYAVGYSAENIFGKQGSTTRSVTVRDTQDPTVTLNGSSTVAITLGDTYTEQGATASDDCDSSLSVTTSGSVDTSTAGTYTITYTTSDNSGNSATATRIVTVQSGSDTGNDEDEEDGSNLTVRTVEPLRNSKIRVTYTDGTTRIIRAFASGPNKPRVKLTQDGERIVVLKRNGKIVRVYDARTGEFLRGKKVRKKKQNQVYLKLLVKDGVEYVVTATSRRMTIRTTTMRLTPNSDRLLNKNTKKMEDACVRFRVRTRNDRIQIKTANLTTIRVYGITDDHELEKIR